VEPATPAELTARKCRPCEGGIPKCPLDESQEQLSRLPGWELTHEGQRIRKDWTVKNFMAGVAAKIDRLPIELRGAPRQGQP